MSLRTETIQGKAVHIVASHHLALLPWAAVRRSTKGPMLLLSFDNHTDTHPAFVNHAYYSLPRELQDSAKHLSEKCDELISQVDIQSDTSIRVAIEKLRYDEHVDAAIRMNIFESALIICWNGQRDECKDESNIYIAGARETFYDEEEYHRNFDPALDSVFLQGRLARLRQMAPKCFSGAHLRKPYILDIDLDYFRTAAAIRPQFPSQFYRLIRGSHSITIALERECVKECRLEGETIDSDMLLKEVLKNIAMALKA